MISRRTALGLLLAVAAGVGAYAAGRAMQPASNGSAAANTATQALLDWLQVPPDQQAAIQQHDPEFARNLKLLRDTLTAKRADLAAALDDPNSSDEAIRARLEAVLAADASLERCVVDYVLTVRHHLTADQQQRLFGLCAEGVRQGPGGGAGRGFGRGFGAGGGGGNGYRGGLGPGSGRGRGGGPG